MRERKIKRFVIAFLLVAPLLTGVVMLTSFTLVKTGDRQKNWVLSPKLAERVAAETNGMNVEQIIDYSMRLTASRLQFSRYNDIPNGKANCVGYAQLCAAICNQALKTNCIQGYARPVVGYIESIGINWCEVLKAIAPKTTYKNFVKDHDFVELTTASKVYHFDPSLHDIL